MHDVEPDQLCTGVSGHGQRLFLDYFYKESRQSAWPFSEAICSCLIKSNATITKIKNTDYVGLFWDYGLSGKILKFFAYYKIEINGAGNLDFCQKSPILRKDHQNRSFQPW